MDIVIVTGASSGMGRDFVLASEREYSPDEIWVIARREDRLMSLASECRTKVRVLAWDLTDRDNFGRFADILKKETPHIRLLINASGYGLFGAFEDLDLDGQLGIADLNDRETPSST